MPTTSVKDTATKTKAVVDHFEKASGHWSNFYRDSIEQISELDLQCRRKAALGFLHNIRAESDSRLRVLDIGCGSGDVLSALDENHWAVHGMDLVTGMVQEAGKQYPASRLAVADAVHVPFRAASMDVVTCLGVLEYVPDWHAALQAMARVLKPGGRLVISIPNKQSLFRRWGHAEAFMLRGIRAIVRPVASGAQSRYARTEWTHRDASRALAKHRFSVDDVAFGTYGMKGRIGDHSKLNLKFAQKFDGKGMRNSIWSRNFAWTMVFSCSMFSESLSDANASSDHS